MAHLVLVTGEPTRYSTPVRLHFADGPVDLGAETTGGKRIVRLVVVIDITGRLTPFGESVDLCFARGDRAEVTGLGHGIGLGVATADGAAMATVSKDAARRVAEQLLRLAD